MEDALEALRKHLDSPEGKASMAAYAQELINKEKIRLSQLERFHLKITGSILNFQKIVKRILKKYRTNKYRNHWYKRGIEPPESLCWFLFEYAELYGRECTKKELKKYGNMFTGALYYYDGYYFNLMHGQGSVVLIFSEKDEIK